MAVTLRFERIKTKIYAHNDFFLQVLSTNIVPLVGGSEYEVGHACYKSIEIVWTMGDMIYERSRNTPF